MFHPTRSPAPPPRRSMPRNLRINAVQTRPARTIVENRLDSCQRRASHGTILPRSRNQRSADTSLLGDSGHEDATGVRIMHSPSHIPTHPSMYLYLGDGKNRRELARTLCTGLVLAFLFPHHAPLAPVHVHPLLIGWRGLRRGVKWFQTRQARGNRAKRQPDSE